MGLADTFGKEDRVEVTFTQFHNIVKESTKAELLMNAVNCDVPHRYIREMATGKSEVIINEQGNFSRKAYSRTRD